MKIEKLLRREPVARIMEPRRKKVTAQVARLDMKSIDIDRIGHISVATTASGQQNERFCVREYFGGGGRKYLLDMCTGRFTPMKVHPIDDFHHSNLSRSSNHINQQREQ